MHTKTNCVALVTDSQVDYYTDDPTINNADINAIVSHIKETTDLYGREAEAVGYFVECDAPGPEVHTFALENVNATRSGEFALHDDDCMLLAELIEARMLLGLWHSHPNAHRSPSAQDWSGHPRSVPMYIVSCEGEGTYLIMRYTDEDRPNRIDPEGDLP